MANRQREERKIKYASAKRRAEMREENEFKPTAFKPPKDVPLFKWEKAGVYRINIIPYIVKEGNPCADEGEAHYERTFFTHKDVGADSRSYACPNKCAGQRCPICEAVARLRRQPDQDQEALKELRPKERQLWLLIDVDDQEKGIQLMECSHFGKGQGFGEMLDNKLEGLAEDHKYNRFWHLEGGMTLEVKTKQDSYNGRKFFKPINIELVPRDEDYPEEVLDMAPCLDDCVSDALLTYDELKTIFDCAPAGGEEPASTNGDGEKKPTGKPKIKTVPKAKDEDQGNSGGNDAGGADDDADADKGKGGKTAAKDDEDPKADECGIEKDCWIEHDEHGVCQVIHISGDGTSLRIRQNGSGEVFRSIAPKDCTVVDAPETDKPAKGKATAKLATGKSGGKDKDWDDDEGKKPAGKPASKPATGGGGKIPTKPKN